MKGNAMNPNLKLSNLTAAVLLLLLITVASSVKAAPRGTPTIVTNDSTSPVAVTGTVAALNSNLYKAVGVTTATFVSQKTNYALSAGCAAEFTGSRICSSEELILAPGRINVGATGAWIMPTIIVSYSGSGAGAFDISGLVVVDSYGNYKKLCAVNNDFTTTCGNPLPVVCCAP